MSIVPEMEEHNKNSFKSKIQVFDKTLKKERKKGKNNDTFKKFLESKFIFIQKRTVLTPMTRSLKEELHQQKKSKVQLEEKHEKIVMQKEMEITQRRGEVSEMKKEMEEMMANEEELERLEEEKDLIMRKMEELEKNNHLLSQKIRGLKSGMSRREKSKASKVINFKEEPLTSSSKSVMTAVHGIIERDVVVVANDDNRTQFFHGKRYYGNHSKHTKSSDGWSHVYAEFAEHKMACSQTSRKEVQKRAKFNDDVAVSVSSPIPRRPSRSH